MSDRILTHAEARRRVEEALRLLEQAQQLTGRAHSLLASVVGVLPQFERVGKLYDRIKDTWHFVAKRRDSAALDLDDVSGPAFLERQRASGSAP